MAKGYIVVDMPKNCGDCEFRDIYDAPYCVGCTITRMTHEGWDRPGWCPIKEIPAKVYHENYCDAGRYDKGWNDLIDEMFGGEDEQKAVKKSPEI